MQLHFFPDLLPEVASSFVDRQYGLRPRHFAAAASSALTFDLCPEIERIIANLQKWEAKQVTGDVFPKITCCQTLPDMSSISCTKTARKGACCTGIWIRVLHWGDLADKDN